MKTLKVGDKGRHLDIPDGYELLNEDVVVTQFMLRHCKVADIVHICWLYLDDEDAGFRAGIIGDYVICKSEVLLQI